jgi:hypothetical protein
VQSWSTREPTLATDRRRIALAALAVLTGALAVIPPAAASAGDERLSKKQWIKSANRICREADDRVGSLDVPSGDPRGDLTPEQFDEIAEYAEQVYDYSFEALDELRSLRPPKRDERAVKKIVRTLAAGVAAIDDTSTAAQQQDGTATVEALTEAERQADRFEDAAKAYGSTCGASSETRQAS